MIVLKEMANLRRDNLYPLGKQLVHGVKSTHLVFPWCFGVHLIIFVVFAYVSLCIYLS